MKWRAGRHRSAIWKSLVLPAGGATLCWLLLMTLWLPLLDFARSYAPLIERSMQVMPGAACIETHGLSRGQIAAFQLHAHVSVKMLDPKNHCPWLVVHKNALSTLPGKADLASWKLQGNIRHPIDRDEDLLIYRRVN